MSDASQLDSESLPLELIRRQERLATRRRNFDQYWHLVASQVLPRMDDFVTQRTAGQRRDEMIYDSTAVYALSSFAAAIESLLTPRTQKWHNIVPHDPKLKMTKAVQQYCEDVRDLLFRVRYRSRAGFAAQTNEVYTSLGAFGNGVLFVDDALSDGIVYQHAPLAECFFDEDGQGYVDTIFRRYKRTVRQAYRRWGEALPDMVSKHLTSDPDREFDFLHVVLPNEDRIPGRLGPKGMKMTSYEVALEGKAMLRVGGYRTMPYAVSRYVTANREVYGRSPAMEALADIRSLNEMSKTALRYGQLVTDPVWLTSDVDSLSPFAVRPGTINAGYLNERGEEMAKALRPEGDPKFGLDIMDQKRNSINRAFLVTLFQILVEDKTRMTATEVMERAQEKGALLAPTMGRQQGDLLDPIINREIDILTQARALPLPPPDLVEAGGVKVQYDSPLSRAQRADEGVGILRTLEAVTPLAQVDQRVIARFNFDRMAVRLAEVNGAPPDILYTDEEMAMKNFQQQQAQQMQNVVAAAPVIAKSAKDLSQAQQAATTPRF